MMDKRYGVVVQRLSAAAATQLNYKDEGRANAAFASIPTTTERKVFVDDFGAKLSVLPSDVGHVLFIDQAKIGELNVHLKAEQMLMDHHAQKKAQEIAEREVVIPRASLQLAPGTKFA